MLKAFVAALALCSILAAQASPLNNHRKPGEPRPQVDQQVHAPYWTMEPGWHSELQLRNNTDDLITVIPTLNLAAGGKLMLESVSLVPNDVHDLDLGAALGKIAPDVIGKVGSFGSISLDYKAAGVTNVYASVMIHKDGSPIAFHLDANPFVPDFTAGSYESIWWKPTSSAQGWLILANPSTRSIAGKLALSDSSGRSSRVPFAIPPGSTQKLNVTELLAVHGLTGEFGGLSIEPNQDQGYLQITHLAMDETVGVSALLKVFGRSVFETRDFSIRAPMVALTVPDPALSLPADLRFTSRVFLGPDRK